MSNDVALLNACFAKPCTRSNKAEKKMEMDGPHWNEYFDLKDQRGRERLKEQGK